MDLVKFIGKGFKNNLSPLALWTSKEFLSLLLLKYIDFTERIWLQIKMIIIKTG